MTLTSLIVSALATWQIIEILNHSSIMSPWRAKVELWRDGRIKELFSCPFCMSPYVALFCLFWVSMSTAHPLCGIMEIVIWAFAASRLANFFNDAGHSLCRTVRHDELLPPLPDDYIPGVSDDQYRRPD